MHVFLLFGVAFGFLLSRAGATEFDAIFNMFLLRDLHLAGVIGVAVVVAGVGLRMFLRSSRLDEKAKATIQSKPMKPGLIGGAVMFGAGWALTGTCPGTGLAQIGEGKTMALFTVAGIFFGTLLYRWVGASVEMKLAEARIDNSKRVVGRAGL